MDGQTDERTDTTMPIALSRSESDALQKQHDNTYYTLGLYSF